MAEYDMQTEMEACLHQIDQIIKEEEIALVKLFTYLGKKKVMHNQDRASKLELDVIWEVRHLQQSSRGIKARPPCGPLRT